MWYQLQRTARRYSYIFLVNLLIFLSLFCLAELSYRVHRDGSYAVILNLKNALHDVPYSNLGTGNWVIYDKELGYRLNPNKPGINRLSIRHGNIATPKPDGLYRVLVLGDSIPWDKEGFVIDLEKMLSKERHIEIINAAVPGYTTFQEVLLFKKYLQQTEPDLVLWTYCLNDNHKFLHRFDEKARMLWTDEALESLKVTSAFDKFVSRSYILSELKLRIIAKGRQHEGCRFPWECAPDFNIAWKDEPWSQYEAYLSEMKHLTLQMHSRLAILVFPYEPQLEAYNLGHEPEYVMKPQKQINALCRKYDVPCLDVFPAFHEKQNGSAKLFRDGIHLSRLGHELTASLVYIFLYENHLLSASR